MMVDKYEIKNTFIFAFSGNICFVTSPLFNNLKVYKKGMGYQKIKIPNYGLVKSISGKSVWTTVVEEDTMFYSIKC